MTRSLLELMEVHAELDELFARHRDLVVELRFVAAAKALDDFIAALKKHMDAEETHILPLYEKRVGPILGGDPEFFRAEHRNLLKQLDAIRAKSRDLAANRAAGPRQAHEFLAAESMFLHLMDHHDRRERNTLYPELDKKLDERERAELLRLTAPRRARRRR